MEIRIDIFVLDVDVLKIIGNIDEWSSGRQPGFMIQEVLMLMSRFSATGWVLIVLGSPL